jgi:hypothetical protein
MPTTQLLFDAQVAALIGGSLDTTDLARILHAFPHGAEVEVVAPSDGAFPDGVPDVIDPVNGRQPQLLFLETSGNTVGQP